MKTQQQHSKILSFKKMSVFELSKEKSMKVFGGGPTSSDVTVRTSSEVYL